MSNVKNAAPEKHEYSKVCQTFGKGCFKHSVKEKYTACHKELIIDNQPSVVLCATLCVLSVLITLDGLIQFSEHSQKH